MDPSPEAWLLMATAPVMGPGHQLSPERRDGVGGLTVPACPPVSAAVRDVQVAEDLCVLSLSPLPLPPLNFSFTSSMTLPRFSSPLFPFLSHSQALSFLSCPLICPSPHQLSKCCYCHCEGPSQVTLTGTNYVHWAGAGDEGRAGGRLRTCLQTVDIPVGT